MSNRSYLATSNSETIYPSFAEKRYDASTQLVATDVESLPLLWLALFRETDLQRKVFKVHGDEIPAFAPMCRKEKAIEQLNDAIPYLARIFPDLGSLEEYGIMFRSAVEILPYNFISIELEEIAGLYPTEHRFEEILTLAMRGFDFPDEIHFHCDDVIVDLSGMNFSLESFETEGMDKDLMTELNELKESIGDAAGGETVTMKGFTAHSHAQILERLSSIKQTVRLPSVRMYLDDLKYTKDEGWNFTRVLGAGRHGSMGYGREVPWEKEDADFDWEFEIYDNEE